MTDALKYLIEQLSQGAATLVVMLLASFVCIWFVSQMWAKFGQHEKHLGKFDGLADRVTKIETKIDLIYINTQRVPVALAHSPISLTPVGVEISGKINASGIFERHKEKLVNQVEAKAPKNAYDIQTEAMKITRETMLGMLNDSELTGVKNEAFQKGILAEDVMMIFGVMLRDEILKSKGISVADVDNHAPRA